MTKKIFAMFLAVLMVMSLLPTSVFAAEKTCPGAGKHTASNCECTVVGVTEPTCGTIGFTTYKCTECDEVFVDNRVAATGKHNLVASEGKAPTCGTAGYEAGLKCKDCSYVEPGKTIASIYDEGTPCEWIDKTPDIDCTTGGVQTWECKHCGATKTEKYNKKNNEHKWENDKVTVVVAPTATANGSGYIKCADCKATKDVVIYNAHDCTDYLYSVEKVDKTCTTNGMETHKECRVCGAIYGTNKAGKEYALNEDGIADLVIPASHSFGTGTCVQTVIYCSDCKKNIDVSQNHSFNWDNATTGKEATCTESGYEYAVCSVCHIAKDTKIIPAKGHNEVTVTVPATCGTFAYTFTYCTRANCQGNDKVGTVTEASGIAYDVKVDSFTAVDSLSAYDVDIFNDDGFYLGMVQTKLDTTLYFNGGINDSGYLTTTSDVAEAVKVNLEIVENYRTRYRMYFYNAEGVKTYIVMNEYKNASGYGAASIAFTTETPSTYYTFDEFSVKSGKCTSLVFTGKCGKYVLGAYNKFDTIGAVEEYYWTKNNEFFARLAKVGVKDTVALTGDVVFDYEAGYNAEKHVLVKEVVTANTCTENGLRIVRCQYCSLYYTETMAAGHNFVKAEDAMTFTNPTTNKVENASCLVDCTANWQWYVCSNTDCTETKRVALPGIGHDWANGTSGTETATHSNQLGYKWIKCGGCDYTYKYDFKVWEEINKQYESVDDAEAVHGEGNLTNCILIKDGDCKTVGLCMYTCSECGKSVYVKQWKAKLDENGNALTEPYITGEHAGYRDNYSAPSCTAAGALTTFQCDRCGEIIGKAALGQTNKISKVAHTWKYNEEYVAADCQNPDYSAAKNDGNGNWYRYCTVCQKYENDGTEQLKGVVTSCTDGYSIEIYKCHCGQVHARSYAEMNHSWTTVDFDKNVDQKATCYATGTYRVKCIYCGEFETRPEAMIEHVNAAGEKFTNKCTDTVTDRHCVVCHEYYEHDKKGSGHNCYKKDSKGSYICEGECIISTDHQRSVESNMPSSCTMPAYTLYVCPDCGKQEMVTAATALDPQIYTWDNGGWKNVDGAYLTDENAYVKDGKYIGIPTVAVDFMGHKPAEADKDKETGEYVLFGGYEYKWITYKTYTWEKAHVVTGLDEEGNMIIETKIVLMQHVDKYLAKYDKYVKPTYTADGYFVTDCQYCGKQVTQTIAKKEGLGFELDIVNGTDDSEQLYFGSLVEVTLNVNSLNTGIYNFKYDLSYDWTCLQYVGYEILNDNFNFVITKPGKEVKDYSAAISITGSAVNDAAGKKQDVVIDGETELVKLYFRVFVNEEVENYIYDMLKIDEDYEDYSKAQLKLLAGKYYDDCVECLVNNGVSSTIYFESTEAYNVKGEKINATYEDEDYEVRSFMDFNNDGFFSLPDLNFGMGMLTGEVDKTYDVSLDINQDGEITLEDLSLAYNFLAGNVSYKDIMNLFLSEAEAKIIFPEDVL